MRVPYDDLPAVLHDWIEGVLGAPVVAATTQIGGFSPGVAARLRCSDGTRAFVKAVSADVNPDSPALHRREAEVLRLLPDDLPVPRLLASYDEPPWMALLVDDVEGRQPTLPWNDDELDRMLALTRAVGEARGLPLEPATEDLRRWTGWSRFAADGTTPNDEWARRNFDALLALEAGAPDAAAGDHLVHLDVRADNVLLSPSRAWLVDWPWAVAGPRWLDVVASAPAVAMQGGPSPEAFLLRSGLVGPDDDEAVTAVVAAFIGMLTWLAQLPPPPGLPTVRVFQAAQAEIGLRWLAGRLAL